MSRPHKSPITISNLIDRLEAAREELLKIQRSFEKFEPTGKSLNGPLKIVSRRRITLPAPKPSE
jgi:hypothetical protein